MGPMVGDRRIKNQQEASFEDYRRTDTKPGMVWISRVYFSDRFSSAVLGGNHILQGSAIIRFYVQFHCSADWYFPCSMVLSSTVLYFYSFIDLQFHRPTDLPFKSSTFLQVCSSTILQKILQLYNLFYTKLHSKFSASTVLHLLPI